MSTTPTTPQWAIEAALEIAHENANLIEGSTGKLCIGPKRIEAILAKHAPSPAAQPTDEAGLRDKIVEILQHYNPTIRTGYGDATRRIMDLFAPHLAHREPGDSELAKELRDMLAELSDVCDGNYYELVKSAKALINRYDKSAMRGEGKP